MGCFISICDDVKRLYPHSDMDIVVDEMNHNGVVAMVQDRGAECEQVVFHKDDIPGIVGALSRLYRGG